MRGFQIINILKQSYVQKHFYSLKPIRNLCTPIYYQFSQKQNQDPKKSSSKNSDQNAKRTNSQINDNIKVLTVKFQDLMECMQTNQYDKGLLMTKKYISDKERNFGTNYEGHEDDLFLLSQFSLESIEEDDNIQKAIRYGIQSFELSCKRKNIKTGVQSYMQLFSIWWDIQDIPEIKQLALQIKELAEDLEVPREFRYEIYNSLAQIYQEEGDFQQSIELLEEYAYDLERVYKMLQQEGENLANMKEKELEKEELQHKVEYTQQRLLGCLLTITRTYQSLANYATLAREWETVSKYMDCSNQIISSLNEEYKKEKVLQQLIKVISSRQYLYYSKQYGLTNQLEKAKEYLILSQNLASENQQQFEKQKTFYYSMFSLHFIEAQDYESSLKYINLIDAYQQNKKVVISKIQKSRDSLAQYVKVLTYGKLNRYEEAYQSLQNYLESQSGKNNRPYVKYINLNTEAHYYESIKDFITSIQKMKECEQISRSFFGKNSAQHQNTKLYHYKLQLQQIIEENSYKENSQTILNIEQQSKECLNLLKSKNCYGLTEQQFENQLQDCLKQLENSK